MIDNLEQIDFMYKDYKILKRPAHKELTENGKTIWVPAKYRKISAPSDELKAEQRRILDEYLSKIKVHECAFGFVEDKDIYDNARMHLDAHSILEMDMKDFFDTITDKQVCAALINNGIEKSLAEYIAKVCTRFGATPQGAPTSPALSNIICKPMDKKIAQLCKENECTYTRYADDVTISGHYENLKILKPKVTSIIHQYGFKINGKKTDMILNNRTQCVTGLVVNKIPWTTNQSITVSKRKLVDNFRALLHTIEKQINEGILHTLDELEPKFGCTIDSLQGYANFIYRANPDKCHRYVEQVQRIRKLLKEKEMV